MQHSPAFLALCERSRSKVREIDIDAVQAWRRAGTAFALIDVREDHEWAAGHAEGAHHLGRGILERDVERQFPDKSSVMVLYCGGGFRSALAAENLHQMGYTGVWSLAGGYKAWQASGAPVVGQFASRGTPQRSIRKIVQLPAPRAAVFSAWTSADGWRAFFGVDARISLEIGGPFEILFEPDEPDGRQGTEGCKVLAYAPDRMVAVSWNAPTTFPEARAQHTWVTIILDETEGGTSVEFCHFGFGAGDRWDELIAYFERAWGLVLDALVRHFERPTPPG